MMRKNQAMPHRIAILALDGVVAFDIGSAVQVFSSARRGDKESLYEVRVCGDGAVRSEGGFTVTADFGLEALQTADSAIVAVIHFGGPVTDGTLPDNVRQSLHEAYNRNARIVSICTGASVLAAA